MNWTNKFYRLKSLLYQIVLILYGIRLKRTSKNTYSIHTSFQNQTRSLKLFSFLLDKGFWTIGINTKWNGIPCGMDSILCSFYIVNIPNGWERNYYSNAPHTIIIVKIERVQNDYSIESIPIKTGIQITRDTVGISFSFDYDEYCHWTQSTCSMKINWNWKEKNRKISIKQSSFEQVKNKIQTIKIR